MLRVYPETPFDAWVCDNQPGADAQFGKGWWDGVEFIRYLQLQGQFPVEKVTIIGDFDMETPPPTEILRMPIFLLRLPELEVCLKNDFSVLEPYWSASVVIHDNRVFEPFGLLAPLDRWKRDLRETFPEGWRFPAHFAGSRKFSCGISNEHALFALFWLMTHQPDSAYSDAWDDIAIPGKPN
jgi:hypothetical protein